MSLDLNAIKTQLKSIFDTANTITASRDLSSGMSRRVQKVLKTNMERLPIQGSLFPAMTIYYDNKVIESDTIAKNQLVAKRKATVILNVSGMVWNPLFSSVDEDPADEDLENLMENAEEILRANPDIGSLATWSFPTDVSYHSAVIDEETHFRVGIMSFEMIVWY